MNVAVAVYDSTAVAIDELRIVTKADFVLSELDSEGLNDRKTQSGIVVTLLVVVSQDKVLLSCEPRGDLVLEPIIRLPTSHKEITEMEYNIVVFDGLSPTLDHNWLVVIGAGAIADDVVMIEVGIGYDVER